MKLLIRTMRDKYGIRNHIIFTDQSGIENPIGVFVDQSITDFIEMYYDEQRAVDSLMLKEGVE